MHFTEYEVFRAIEKFVPEDRELLKSIYYRIRLYESFIRLLGTIEQNKCDEWGPYRFGLDIYK